MEDNAKLISALQDERRGYVARNLHDRVKAVDEQLRLLGVGSKRETTTAEPAEERAVVEAPKKRIAKRD
jgi:hypothetical protein